MLTGEMAKIVSVNGMALLPSWRTIANDGRKDVRCVVELAFECCDFDSSSASFSSQW
jgi:hypothetical protein